MVTKKIQHFKAIFKIPGLFRPLDYAAFVLALGLSAFTAAVAYTGSGGGLSFVIKGAEDSWICPADREDVFSIPGPLGDTVVEIRDHKARVLSSPCLNQSCVSAGEIHVRGQWIACLPNRVLVSVENGAGSGGARENGLDAAAW
jgi:hypothetical protein